MKRSTVLPGRVDINPCTLLNRALCIVAASLVVVIGGCASSSKRPVFYPNAHIETVGRAKAERDVDACMALAREYGVSQTKDGEVSRKAVTGAALGGVGAGVWGLIRDPDDALERAAAGAAAGAATGATKGAIESTELNPTFKRFTERCLRDRGYDVIGWE